MLRNKKILILGGRGFVGKNLLSKIDHHENSDRDFVDLPNAFEIRLQQIYFPTFSSYQTYQENREV